MLFYTNVNRIGNDILVRGYKDGKRVKGRVEFKPTLYVPTKEETKFRTIDGRPVGAIKPGTMRDCRDFIKKYENIDNFEVHGNQNYVHQYIGSTFTGHIKFDRSLVRVTTVDIEVQSDQGFPNPDIAQHPVTAITIKDNIDDTFYVFGCGDYNVQRTVVENAHIKYIQCNNEHDLMSKFIDQCYWMELSYV